jgi:hypothetical protein
MCAHTLRSLARAASASQPHHTVARLERAACVAVQVALSSQQAHCVRLVVDALLAGRFSKVSVVLHLYDALQALIHDPQVCVRAPVFDSACILLSAAGVAICNACTAQRRLSVAAPPSTRTAQAHVPAPAQAPAHD